MGLYKVRLPTGATCEGEGQGRYAQQGRIGARFGRKGAVDLKIIGIGGDVLPRRMMAKVARAHASLDKVTECSLQIVGRRFFFSSKQSGILPTRYHPYCPHPDISRMRPQPLGMDKPVSSDLGQVG